MINNSNIEWTEVTWNPTTGCSKISTGCTYCYAEIMSRRLQAMGIYKYRNGFRITLHPEALETPHEWKKPKTVFVDSMSDLFHTSVPVEFIKKDFEVMNRTPQHTYQVLTKRSDRIEKIAHQLNWTDNIWMGVSVENERVSERIPNLINSPAKVKFLSCEPLIGPLNSLYLDKIDWVIVGGESGPKARLLKKEWVEYIKDQCNIHRVPFFFKQWGKRQFNDNQNDPTMNKENKLYAKGGCELDGNVIQEMPNRVFQPVY
ncbi:MAG: phage Gp37/Gp68 family protein [Bacteroidales bacterium]|nr:phage Gp37/Gp68 family protein [Bacteroidales bacterium]